MATSPLHSPPPPSLAFLNPPPLLSGFPSHPCCWHLSCRFHPAFPAISPFPSNELSLQYVLYDKVHRGFGIADSMKMGSCNAGGWGGKHNFCDVPTSAASYRATQNGPDDEDEVYVKSFSGERWQDDFSSVPFLRKGVKEKGGEKEGRVIVRRGRTNTQFHKKDVRSGSSDSIGEKQRWIGREDRAGSSAPREKPYASIGMSENRVMDDNAILRRRKKETSKREQVRFSAPVNKDPHIAIIGGGMSGLICARTLEERGIKSTVFDSGKHGLGGRMATRHVALHNGFSLTFDHAAQFFTVTDVRFRNLVDQWISEGAVREWNGVLGGLHKGGHFVEIPQSKNYIASCGMRNLADHIVSRRHLISVKRPCWISRMNAYNCQWHLTENGQPQGQFDAVVIAHNGKCANRLLDTAGVPLVAKQMKRLELSSIWALLAAFEEPIPPPKNYMRNEQLDAAFIDGVDSVSWMANNTRKLLLSQDQRASCWTFFSTAAYGKKNKVPQESIPTVKAEKVKRQMLQGVEIALGIAEGSLSSPLYTRVQLWGAALPTNSPNIPCIFDPLGRVGICGDWLLGSSLEAAALSGMAMAHHIADYTDRSGFDPEGFSIGLYKEFSKLDGYDIGQFPGVESVHQPSPMELLTVV
eukprot:c22436_g1_i1 orf=103-2016(+)